MTAHIVALFTLLAAPAVLADTDATDTDAADGADETIHVVRVGPGCFGSSWNSVNVAGALFDPMARDHGAYFVTALSQSAVERDRQWLFPDAAHAADPAIVVRVITDEGTLTREVLDDALPVLLGAEDLAFQWPRAGHTDVLALIEEEMRRTGGLADSRRVQGRLVRTTRGTVSALELELPGEEPPPAIDDDKSIAGWDRRYMVTATVRPGDDDVTLYAFGRVIGGAPRIKAALDAAVAKATRERTLIVHLGNVAGDLENKDGRAICVDEMKRLGLDVIVPRSRDIALGRDALLALAKEGALPFVAANLKNKDDTRPFPRFTVIERAGLTIGVIGVMNPEAIAAIPASLRPEWRIEPAPRAVEDSVKAMHDRLRRYPDLTIVMGAYADQELDEVTSSGHVDIVLRDEDGSDIIARTTRVTVDDVRGGRELQRGQRASLVAAGPPFAVSDVSARFSGAAANGRKRLVELVHELTPVVDGMPRDERLAQRLRPLEEKAIARDSVTLFPDPDAFIRAHAELAPLVWGERVLYLGGFQRQDRSWSPFITDALWMHVVVNVLKRVQGTEVVLARNLPRSSDVLGPVPRFVVVDWLGTPDSTLTLSLSGKELLQIAERINKQQDASANVAAADYVFAAGLDAAHGRVGGRAINPDERYTVTATDSLAALPDLAGIFHAHQTVAGPPLSERVLGYLQSGGAKPDELLALLLEHNDVVEDRLSAGFDELSLSGSAFRSSENRDVFGAARETRLSNPNLFQIGARVNAFALYDGPWLANEWRLRAQYDGIVFDVPGQQIPPQEQRDDVVASTELRINKIKVGVAGDDFQIIPFVQAAFDTELTATPSPAADAKHPLLTLPHQYLVRESAGVVTYPGAVVREVRVGALVQHDLSELADGRAFNDFGAIVGGKLHLPVVWQVAYDSELDARYLIPDGDDRVSDLALRLQCVNKLTLPLSPSMAFFVFLDAFVASGKVSPSDVVGWNGIVGAGVQWTELWKR